MPLAFLAAVLVLIGLRWRAVVAEEGYEAPFGFSVMARATQSADPPPASRDRPAGRSDPAAQKAESGREASTIPPAGEEAVAATKGESGRSADRRAAAKPSRLDLNHASAAELKELPGVGPVLAGRIVSYRNEHGPFKTVDELDQVKGVGPKLLEKLRPLLYVRAE